MIKPVSYFYPFRSIPEGLQGIIPSGVFLKVYKALLDGTLSLQEYS